MEKREKVHWMSRYLRSVQKQKQLRLLVKELEGRARGGSTGWGGMPHGPARQDRLARAVERLDEARADLGAEAREGLRFETEIENAIDTVADPNVRMILYYRFLEGKTWDETAELVGYDKRWAQRLCDKALLDLQPEAPKRRRGRPRKNAAGAAGRAAKPGRAEP